MGFERSQVVMGMLSFEAFHILGNVVQKLTRATIPTPLSNIYQSESE